MKDFLFIFLIILLVSFKYVLNMVQFSDSFIAYYEGQVDEKNFKTLEEYGYVFDKKIDIGPGFYRYVLNGTRTRGRLAPPKAINQTELKKKDPKLLSFEQEPLWFRERKTKAKVDIRRSNDTLRDKGFDVINRSKRALTILDKDWNKQWQLDPGHVPSMGVYNVWDIGFTGKGVTIAIVDDGIHVAHTDLRANYNAALSYDIINNVPDPSHRYVTDGHGTNCAGVVAAVKNTNCVIGTAYEATIVAIRLLDDLFPARGSDDALALVHQLASIDIYSNSWGAHDDGKDFGSGLQQVQQAALWQGVKNGRGGKGVIYVWAAGNGGQQFDDCNVDGYASSIYTISVNSLAPDSSPAYYAEQCTSVMVATYGGDARQDTIATTGPQNTCVDDFQGTSAACPIAAGIIALVLQANPNLTWRDIQHMIVEYSTNTGLRNANFYTNGAGKKVSLTHGFGLMNAERMVNAAPGWKTVPTHLWLEGSTTYYNRETTGIWSLSSRYTVNNHIIKHLEHVVVNINFKASYREYTSFYLVSPAGTSSRLLRERPNDAATSSVTWSFMSVHTWGENPAGTWTLIMQSSRSVNNGEYGGYCNGSVTCKGAESYCLSNAKICVSCQTGHHLIGGSCLQDGSLGGFCNGSTVCMSAWHRCNLATYRCVSCDNGYHIISGRCLQDGVLGGYCNSNITCVVAGTGCRRTSLTCVTCGVGYRVIGGFCEQDGAAGGFCDNSTICTNPFYNCEDNICKPKKVVDQDTSSANDNNAGVIVGALIGGLVVLCVVVAVVIKYLIGRKLTVRPVPAQAENSPPPGQILHSWGSAPANNHYQRY